MPILRWLLPLALCAGWLAGAAAAQPVASIAAAGPVPASVGSRATDMRARLQHLSPLQKDEVLWLARCVYSESDRAHEQRLVAWVVRNRVETGFRGHNYRSVVLEPQQFSAFNEPTARRSHILSLGEQSTSSAWRQALDVALDVYQAPAAERPFNITTRHFYSPISMQGGRKPPWAEQARALPSNLLGVDPYRFQFFDNLDEGRGGAGRDPSLAPPDRPIARTRVASAQSDGQYTESTTRPRIRSFSGRVQRPVRPRLERPTRR